MAGITVRQGTAVKVTATFTDANDVVFDPDNVYFTYVTPYEKKITVQYNGGAGDVSRDEAGVYTYWIDTRSASGTWSVTVYSDDPNVEGLVSEKATISVTAGDVESFTDGPGTDVVTLTIIESDDNVIADAVVWVTSDANGDTIVAGKSTTDANGQVIFNLVAATTYYLWASKAGWELIEGEEFVAVAD